VRRSRLNSTSLSIFVSQTRNSAVGVLTLTSVVRVRCGRYEHNNYHAQDNEQGKPKPVVSSEHWGGHLVRGANTVRAWDKPSTRAHHMPIVPIDGTNEQYASV